MITTVTLFEKLERLRAQALLTIDDIATPLLKVSNMTYKKWRKGVIPDAHREPVLREAVQLLHVAIEEGLLPVRGKPKLEKTRTKRRGILDGLLAGVRED